MAEEAGEFDAGDDEADEEDDGGDEPEAAEEAAPEPAEEETPAPADDGSSPDYSSMTVAELKELLKAAGKPVSGKKADLVARLNE